MPRLRIVDSLAKVECGQWSRLFPAEPEGYDYLTAVETARLPGFQWRYLLVECDGDLMAAAPAFLTHYALETTLTGPGRRLAEGLKSFAPRALTMRLACVGSPCTERALVGFDPGLGLRWRIAFLRQMLMGFERLTEEDEYDLLGIKDAAASDCELWSGAARELGYVGIGSLPSASLDIDFDSLDDYLARLSPGTRKDMRRKLRAQDQVRIEVRGHVDDLLDPVMTLYRQTRARGEMAFEELTADFFRNIAARMPGQAFFVLYFQGEDLLAMNLVLEEDGVLLDKFFCMDAARGRPLNLYFLSWFTNIGLCLDWGLRRYQSGQAGYENKLRLGSRLDQTTNYFRHRNPLVNGGLRLAAPLFAADAGVALS